MTNADEFSDDTGPGPEPTAVPAPAVPPTPTPAPAPDPDLTAVTPGGLEVLDHCAVAAGLEFDPVLARRLLDQAARLHPGPPAETWLPRLAEAARAVGFRVSESRWTPRQAVTAAVPALPVIAFVPDAAGTGGSWVVLLDHVGRKARVAGARPGDPDRWLDAAAIARLVGAAGAGSPARWAVLQPITPCDGLRNPDAGQGHGHGRGHDAGHGGGHGHGHGHGPGHAPAHGHGLSPLRRLYGLIRPEWRDIKVVIAYAVGISVLSLATPLAIEALINTVARTLLVQQLVVLTLILLGCLGLAAALRSMQTWVVELIQRRLFVRLAADLSYRLPRVPLEAYDRQNGPELINRFFDVLTVQKVASMLLLDGIAILLQSAVGLVVLGLYNVILLGFDLAVIGAMSFLVFQIGRGAVRTSIRESRAKYAVAAGLEEMARTPLAFKGRGGYDYALDRTDGLLREYLTARAEHFRILFRQITFALGLQAVATSTLLGLGGWLVINGQLNFGQLVAAELIVALVVGSFAKLGKQLEGWYDLMAAVDKIGHLVDLPLERDDGEALRALAPPGGTALTLRGVAYSYGGHHHPVLHGLDLSVAPGERLAIVGASGSGKSTLAELLYGLRAPGAGHIAFDGVNLRDLSLEALRSEVALVQGLDLIEDTILENVRAGRTGISLGEAHDALVAVGLADEVAHLPDGMHTRVMASGPPLSLGQARRLMLARALVGRPRLLVLDEALDGLDLDSRGHVFDTIFDPAAPWTLVVVTHEQVVAARCDRAVALAGGHLARSTPMNNGHSADLETWLKETNPWRHA